MRRFLYLPIFLVWFSCSALYAQYGLQASMIIPTGYYSYLLKPAPAVDLIVKLGDADDYYSFGAFIGYTSLKPTQDTFRTYAVGGSYTTQLLPGYEVIHTYEMLSFGVSNDLRILPDSKFCPIVGLDVSFTGIAIDEDDYAEGLVSSSGGGNDFWLLSIVPRAGLQFKLNDEFYILGGLGRSISFTGTAPQQSFWKPFLSIIYYPD